MEFRDQLRLIGQKFGIDLTPENVDRVQHETLAQIRTFGQKR